MRRELYEVAGGWGYRLIDDGGRVCVEQPFKPGEAGFVTMTAEEAAHTADMQLASPSLTASTSQARIGQTVTISLEIGPEGYAGTVKWFEGDTLLGEVNAANRSAVLEYTPDAAGTVIIRAGNDVYGFTDVRLEVVE